MPIDGVAPKAPFLALGAASKSVSAGKDGRRRSRCRATLRDETPGKGAAVVWRRRSRRHSEPNPTVAAATARQALLMNALRAVAGTGRGLIYDVPFAMRPALARGSGPFVRATPAWDRFIRARRQLDDGQLTLVLALRPLDDEERRLVVDSGTTYSNAFLL